MIIGYAIQGLEYLFQGFPFTDGQLIVWAVMGIALLLMCGFTIPIACAQAQRGKVEVTIPEGASAWTIHKSNPWVKFYYIYWSTYPRDICTYFWKSLLLLIFSLIIIVSLCVISAGAISILCWFGYGIWRLLPLVAEVIFSIPFLSVFIGNGVISLATYWIGYLVAGSTALLIMIVLFLRSNTGRVIRLRIKAWKRGVCPLIHVAD